MIDTGLVSVTFRKHTPREVVSLVAQAGLHAIEWGGDVHVPHGDAAAAREARQLTQEAGLRVAAYGSYFRCRPGEDFEPVLASAIELGVPLIRIWAGDRPSADADPAYREHVAATSRRVADEAARHGVAVAYECHAKTLTDTTASMLDLLAAAPGMRTLWQPPHDLTEPERLAGLQAVLPRLVNLHVFHWRMPDRLRLPLSDGAAVWPARLALAASTGRDFDALLEFVRDDDPAQFLADARTLREWTEPG